MIVRKKGISYCSFEGIFWHLGVWTSRPKGWSNEENHCKRVCHPFLFSILLVEIYLKGKWLPFISLLSWIKEGVLIQGGFKFSAGGIHHNKLVINNRIFFYSAIVICVGELSGISIPSLWIIWYQRRF
jgi:hypothetical protein